MKRAFLAAGVLATSLLAGCEGLSRQGYHPVESETTYCLSTIPSLEESECLVDAWVEFGLAAQRGDAAWRERILAQADGEETNERLARAVVYSWADQAQWAKASELYKADLAFAPSRLQPLLRQWLNGLEARRELAQQAAKSETSRRQAIRERDELAQKLEALTEIEQSINLRN
ncbi:MAG: hypothetical protein UMU75_02295 [Halomonas sp.]|nr:hypothetical protein [Halomonas sp.]